MNFKVQTILWFCDTLDSAAGMEELNHKRGKDKLLFVPPHRRPNMEALVWILIQFVWLYKYPTFS